MHNCGYCRFFNVDKDNNGTCRRFPPQGVHLDYLGKNPKARWNCVAETDWCGEWTQAEGEIMQAEVQAPVLLTPKKSEYHKKPRAPKHKS